MLPEREDVIVVQHDVEPVEVAGEAAHLHMVALPDDDHVVAIAGEGRDGAVDTCTSGHVASTTVSPRARVLASVRSDVPWAVTIRVVVLTSATSCATAMPFCSRVLRTVGLWTRSPRIVSGPASACSRASAMASRTPKHMPR